MIGAATIIPSPFCVTFSYQAQKIWGDLKKARARGNIRDEETVTNDFLSDVQQAHPNDAVHFQFRKKEEKFTGADWEWWLSDGNLWFGLLVQAKILHAKRQTYSAIKHKVGAAKNSQIDILIEHADRKGIDAVYAFYNYRADVSEFKWNCKSTLLMPEQLGCTLAHAHAVRNAVGRGGAGVRVLSPIMLPLRCLGCCGGYTGPNGSLPARVDSIVRVLRNDAATDVLASGTLRLRDHPPWYVERLLAASLDDRGEVFDGIRREIGDVRSLLVTIEPRAD